MSATKVFIDPNEDLVFTVHKINAADSKKVILVLPVGANVSSSQVSLKLLSRMLARSDKLVVLVTDDILTRKYAQRSKLKVVSKVSEVSQDIWEEANTLKQELIIHKDKKKMELLADRTEANTEVEIKEDTDTPKLGQRPEKKAEEPVAVEENLAEQNLVEEQSLKEGQAGTSPEEVSAETESEETSVALVTPPPVAVVAEPEVEPTIELDLDAKEVPTPPAEVIVPTENIKADEEVKPLFSKMEPKIMELNNFALLAGGDVSQSALAPILKNKLKFVTRQLDSLANAPAPEPETVGELRQQNSSRHSEPANFGQELEESLEDELPRHSIAASTSTEEVPNRAEEMQVKLAAAGTAAKATLSTWGAKLAEGFNSVKSKVQDKVQERRAKSANVSSQYMPAPRTSGGRSITLGKNYARTSLPVRSTNRLQQRNAMPVNHDSAEGDGFLTNLRQNAPFYIERLSQDRAKVAGGAAAVLVSIVLLSLFVFSSAEVTITVESRNIPVTQAVRAAKDLTLNTDTGQMSLRSVSKPGSTSISAPATGKGEKGEKATTLINILNPNNQAVTVNAGTVISLVGKNNLDYVIGNTVTIPAVESAKNIRITATAIGEQYNQLNNSKKDFAIKGKVIPGISLFTYDQIAGGTKQAIVIVSESDIAKARESVIAGLKESITSEVNALISESEMAITGQLKYTEPQINVSKKAGEEAESFDVGVTMTGEMLVISKEDLNQIAQAAAAKNADAAGDFSIKEIERPTVTEIKEDKDAVTFTLTSAAKLSADIDPAEVKKKIAGSHPDAAKEELAKIQDVKDVKLNYSPQFLPGFLRRIPSDTGKITVKIIK